MNNFWVASQTVPVPDDVARLLETVPEWFGQPESNADYIDSSKNQENWVVRNANNDIIGITLLERRFPVLEIHLMVVDRKMQGKGIGTAMLKAIEADAFIQGIRIIEVKTLGESHPDLNYARTRHFYEQAGFLPLEDNDLWGADTPCLIMVKPLP